MTDPDPQTVRDLEAMFARRPLGQGCACVDDHSPAAYIPAEHHIIPLSWDGPDIRENKRLICPNTHTATHRLIDEYVRAGGDPGWEVRRHFGVYVRELARFAWDHRPPKPTITSLTGDHT
jgi:hypothetical protein